jgi:hypothetical protein
MRLAARSLNARSAGKAAAQSKRAQFRVLHLCSIRTVKESSCEFPVISIARTRCRETLCSLFSIEAPFPKLNVAPDETLRFFGTVRVPKLCPRPAFLPVLACLT